MTSATSASIWKKVKEKQDDRQHPQAAHGGGERVKRFLGGLVTGGAAALVTWGLTENTPWTIVVGVLFAVLVWTRAVDVVGGAVNEMTD